MGWTFCLWQVFPFGVAKFLDPQDDRVLTVDDQCLKPVVTNKIDHGLIDSINLVGPVYYG